MACEKVKTQISSASNAQLVCEIGGIVFSKSISRALFDRLNIYLFEKTLVGIKDALIIAGMDKSEIDEIILVGGSSRIPKIHDLLTKFFDRKTLNDSINPDEAVAIGAAKLADTLTNSPALSVALIERTPFAPGIALTNGEMGIVIESNMTIQTKNTQSYCTSFDNQERVVLPVYEGNDMIAEENNFLDKFTVRGIPLKPKGEVKVLVTSELDVNRILHVKAVETSEGRSATIKIHKLNGMSAEKMESLTQRTREFAEADDEVRKSHEIQNELEEYCQEVLGLVQGMKRKNDDTEWNNITVKCNEVLDSISGNPSGKKAEYEQCLEDMRDLCRPIFAKKSECGVESDDALQVKELAEIN